MDPKGEFVLQRFKTLFQRLKSSTWKDPLKLVGGILVTNLITTITSWVTENMFQIFSTYVILFGVAHIFFALRVNARIRVDRLHMEAFGVRICDDFIHFSIFGMSHIYGGGDASRQLEVTTQGVFYAGIGLITVLIYFQFIVNILWLLGLFWGSLWILIAYLSGLRIDFEGKLELVEVSFFNGRETKTKCLRGPRRGGDGGAEERGAGEPQLAGKNE